MNESEFFPRFEDSHYDTTHDDSSDQEREVVENIRNNPYFTRLCKGFFRYQEILADTTLTLEEKKEISARMHELHMVGEINLEKFNDDSKGVSKPSGIDDIFEYALQSAEKRKFDSENFLQFISKNNEILSDLFDEWNPKSGDSKAGEYEYVNSLVAFTKKNDKTISLHILPVGALQPAELLTKIAQGFKEIAQKITTREISCKDIEMKSWLLGSGIKDKFESILTKLGNVDHPIDQNTEDVIDIQRLALLFNTKSLENYLLTGKRPEVRAIDIEAKKFAQAFV